MGNTSQNNWRNKMTARLVCEWGHNDMVGVPGWRAKDCPFYQTWHNMLTRRQNLGDRPCYRGVTVCEEWKYLSHFIAWAETKDYKEKCLDKDILIPGNKGYRLDACLFVKQHINTLGLRIDPEKPKSGKKYPEGVQLRKRLTMPNVYRAKIQIDGEQEYLESFPTVEAASSAYCKAKAEYLRELAEKQEPILKEALLRWADIYENASLLSISVV